MAKSIVRKCVAMVKTRVGLVRSLPMFRCVLSLLGLLIFSPWFMGSTYGQSWQLETIDASADWTSIAVGGAGVPHVAYWVVSGASYLKYAKRLGPSSWDVDTVATGPGISYVGQGCSITLLGGNPHISYGTMGGPGYLKHAYWDGSNWVIEEVDTVGYQVYDTSIRTDGSGVIHIFYAVDDGGANKRLKYARKTATWQTEFVDNADGGSFVSLDIGPGNVPHVSFIRDDWLRYKQRIGPSNWSGMGFDPIDMVGLLAIGTSIKVDNGGDFHVAVNDVDNPGFYTHEIWHSDFAGGTISQDIVEHCGSDICRWASLVRDGSGYCHTAYGGSNVVTYAENTTGSWQIDTVAVAYGDYICMDLDGAGNPHIVFYSTDLMYACRDTSGPGTGPRIYVHPEVIFSLSQNYPNPVARLTTIQYGLPKEILVDLRVFNVAGQQVKTLVSKKQAPGYYRVTWDLRGVSGERLPNGVYFYRLRAEDFRSTKKLVVLR